MVAAGEIDANGVERVEIDRNLHLILRRLAEDVPALDIWHASSDCNPSYVDEIPREYFSLWKTDEREWASRLYHGAGATAMRARYIDIYRALRDLPVGPERNRLVDEALELEK